MIKEIRDTISSVMLSRLAARRVSASKCYATKQLDPEQKHLRMTQRGAFTLIELLVVVLIIGVLAAVALPGYQTAVEKSRAAEALTNLRHAKQAYELLHLQDPSAVRTTNPEDFIELSGGTWAVDDWGEHLYCTRNFLYYIHYGQLSAIRCTPKDNCMDCQTHEDYNIDLSPSYRDNPLEQCQAWTDLGFRICAGLPGLEIVDDR